MENLRRKETLKILNVYYIPTYAQISSVDLYQITPTCFGVNTSSSGSLQVVFAKVMTIALAEVMNMTLANTSFKLTEDGILTPKHVGLI